MTTLFDPLVTFDCITADDLNAALVAWGHKMGPLNRPAGRTTAHGLRHNSELVAVVATSDLVSATCAGFSRGEAIELARLCAARQDLCRPVLRLWREFVFPCFGQQWAVSYQDESLHSGNTYRFDGWVRLGRSRSGVDTRSGRQGRAKTIWGWHPDKAVRLRAGASPDRKAA